jgi:DNA-binding NtrC family response regulator
MTILVADRNRHVRDYLQRELSAEGYRVLLAKNGRQVLDRIANGESMDLIVLDLNLPDERDLKVLEKIHEQAPGLPVVVHGFWAEYRQHPSAFRASFVEKQGGSIEDLKGTVAEMLQKPAASR